MLQEVIPESATTQVKELFVLPAFLDAARLEAQTLPSLEIVEVFFHTLCYKSLQNGLHSIFVKVTRLC